MKLSTTEQIVRDLRTRKKIVSHWKGRIARLSMPCRQFCIKHDEATAQMSRYKNGKELPGWEVINRIEKKLTAEGV